jgi:hypothetical protein
MNYGLLTYKSDRRNYNIGDYIQSLAARQYLPRVDCFLDREHLAEYDGPEIKIILNGWFVNNPDNWLPAPTIKPLFISFHLNSSVIDRVLNDAAIEYLKKHSPIGCRDKYTVKVLQDRGIPAYYSGCLTLTLSGFRNSSPSLQKDYIVDPLYGCQGRPKIFKSTTSFLNFIKKPSSIIFSKKSRLIDGIISPVFYKKSLQRKHALPQVGVNVASRFNLAEKYLREYADARLVVTSRIHCALPCLAMGVPVIFINAFDSHGDTCRFDGLIELFNRFDVNPEGVISNNFGVSGKIDGNYIPQNLNHYIPLAEKMRATCEEFIRNEEFVIPNHATACALKPNS